MRLDLQHAHLRERLRMLHGYVYEIEKLLKELEARAYTNRWTAPVQKFLAGLDPARNRFTMNEVLAALGVESPLNHRGIRLQIGRAIAAEGWVRLQSTMNPDGSRKQRYYQRPKL